jgi:proteic killer suppression protein
VLEVEFADADLDRLEIDPKFQAGVPQETIRSFRKVMQTIRAAVDSRDLYAFKGLRTEQLSGKRKHQHSLRLNGKWRLIVELGSGGKHIRVIEIVDYH